jgi:hypothetical protein
MRIEQVGKKSAKAPTLPAPKTGTRKSAPKAACPEADRAGALLPSTREVPPIKDFREEDGTLSWNPVSFLDPLRDLIKKGFPWDLAAIGAGLTPQDLHQWFVRAHTGEEPFATVCVELHKARTSCIQEYLDSIRIASKDPKHWQAAKWWLETQEKDFFGPVTTINMTDPTKPPDTQDREEVDPVERSAAVLEVLLRHGVFKPGLSSDADTAPE